MTDSRAVVEAEQYLNQIPRFSRRKHTLDDLRDLLRFFHAELPEEKVIHIAGTNGKGSVCAFLESIFRTAGQSTALFTSPHLVSIRERFVFDGMPVSNEEFLQAYHGIHMRETALQAKGYTIPTYFEYLFLMFCLMVQHHPTDRVILETGLGGRLDATNCTLRPSATVISSISFDHMQYLGNSIPEIAAEKAGIIKDHVPVFFDDNDAEASQVIRQKAEEKHAPCIPVGDGDITSPELHPDRLRYQALLAADTDRNAAENAVLTLRQISVPIPAIYQTVNSLLAIRVAEHFLIPTGKILEGIQNTRWAGRMEEIAPGVYIDGAHNEGGIKAFAKSADMLAKRLHARQRLMVFTVSGDKSYEKMLHTIHTQLKPDLLILTTMESYRGLPMDTLKAAVLQEFTGEHPRIEITLRVKDALSKGFREKGEQDILFCVGSLYLIGEIWALLQKRDTSQGETPPRKGDAVSQ